MELFLKRRDRKKIKFYSTIVELLSAVSLSGYKTLESSRGDVPLKSSDFARNAFLKYRNVQIMGRSILREPFGTIFPLSSFKQAPKKGPLKQKDPNEFLQTTPPFEKNVFLLKNASFPKETKLVL